MVIIEQTAWYQEFLTREGQRHIKRLLEHRSGAVPPHITEALQTKTVEQLDRLILDVLDVPSLDAFEERLKD